MSADQRHALVIFNPKAGARRYGFLKRTLSALEPLGISVKIQETERPGHAEIIAKQAGQSVNAGQPDILVAAGGDGTIHEVANGLAGTGLPLAIIPLGTANVLAHEIGLPRSPEAIAASIVHGKPTTVHLGRIGERRFIMMASIGFDAESVRRVNLGLKSVIGRGAYGLAALEQFFLGDHPVLDVTVDEETHKAGWVVAGNGHYYAGGFSLTPNARLTDPSLEICLYKGTSHVDIARNVLSSLIGQHRRFRDVELLSTKSLLVEGPPEAVVQADGDVIGNLPVTISSEGGTIELIYPPAH